MSAKSEKEPRTVGFVPFDELADKYRFDLYKVRKMNCQASLERLRATDPDFIIVIGWSELVGPEILDLPRIVRGAQDRHGPGYGCVGMHPTLLPEGRGRAPIPWSIIRGLSRSGVSIFYLEEGADEGDIIAQRDFSIEWADDAQSIYDRVAAIHYRMMTETIPSLLDGTAPRIPQADLAKRRGFVPTYWTKREPKDGIIDWNTPAPTVYNWIRAQTKPYPGAFTYLNGRKLIVWRASLHDCDAVDAPGTALGVEADCLVVSCAQGSIHLQSVEPEGFTETTGKEFVIAHNLRAGDRFDEIASA